MDYSKSEPGREGSRKVKTVRELNVTFLVVSLGLMATLAVSLYFLHSWQVGRTAKAFLERASHFEKEGNWFKAADYINNYVRLTPQASEEKVRLARVFAKGAENFATRNRAIQWYYEAIGAGVEAEETALRQETGELLLKNGRFLESQGQAEKILEKSPQNANALRMRAISLYGLYQQGALNREDTKVRILDALSQAVATNPTDVELASLLANAYRDGELAKQEIPDVSEAKRFAMADACLDSMLKSRTTDTKLYLARYLYRLRWNVPGAKDDLEAALKLSPADPQVLLFVAQDSQTSAIRLARSGAPKAEVEAAFKNSEELFRKILENEETAKNFAPHIALGEVLLALGKRDEAVASWKTGLEKCRSGFLEFHAHLAGVWLDASNPKEAEPSIDAIDKYIAQPTLNIERKARLTLVRDQALRRGVWRMLRGEIAQAIPPLKQVTLLQEQLGGDFDQSTRAWYLLGNAYAASGEWSESAQAYDNAAAQQPKWAAPRIAAATSWLAGNRIDHAVDRAEHGVKLESSCKAWYTLAAAIFQQQALAAEDERLWGRCEMAINEAIQRASDGSFNTPWRLDFLHADYLLAKPTEKENVEDARKRAVAVLRQSELRYPNFQAFWSTLPLVYQRMGERENADRACDQLAKIEGSEFDAVLVRARLCSLRGEHDAAEKVLASVDTKNDKIKAAALRQELINAKIARRDLVAARKLLEEVVQDTPQDINSLRRMAELDIESRNYAGIEQWENALRAAGPAGETLSRYFKVRRLLLQAENAVDVRLNEAEDEVNKLIASRPTWAEAVALKALIDQRRGRLDSAIMSFEQSIALGEQRLAVFEQLIGLLERANRSADAEKYLSRLQSHVPISQELTVFESTVEIRKNQPDQAVAVARRGVESRPKDPAALVWLGRVLLINHQKADAERAFKDAILLDKTDVRTWNALFSFYLRTGETEQARKTLKQLAVNSKLNAEEKYFIVAQGHELLGEDELAVEAYQKALEAEPKSTAILLRMAGFYLRNNPEEAQVCLRKVLRIDPKSGVARRTLAAIMAARGKDEDWKEVERLLGTRPADDPTANQDARLQAVLLMQQGGLDNYQRAVKMLEELIARPESFVTSDRLLLAQLFEKLGRIAIDSTESKNYYTRAREQYVSLCARATPQPSHLASFVEFLLRQGNKAEAGQWLNQYADHMANATAPTPVLMVEYIRLCLAQGDEESAEKWLVKLEKAEPDSLVALTLRSMLLVRQNKREEVEPRVEAVAIRLEAMAKDDQSKAMLYQGLGSLYGTVESWKLAEKWFRKLYATIPTAFEPLVATLVRQERITEALEICQKEAERTGSTTPALSLIGALANGKAAVTEVVQIERLVDKALKDHPADVRLLLGVATLRVMQGKTDEAIEMFRKVVDLNPRHVIALNNLATLLSEKADQRQEALKLIDKAIAVTGSEAALYDTKGTILVLDGQADKAIQYLKAAVDGKDSDPRFRFHLALAYRDLKEIEQAKSELERALKQNLEKELLTPNEQKLLSELRTILTP